MRPAKVAACVVVDTRQTSTRSRDPVAEKYSGPAITPLYTHYILALHPPTPCQMNRENSKLLSLPAELRLRIYANVLHFSYPLYRPLRASIIHPWHYISDQNSDDKINTNNLADTALLLTNRQIHHEAKDCFYELNSFRVSFNHLCSCQNIFPYPAYCQDSGMGLIDYLLHDLPKLHAATIAFEDIFTFSESIGPIMRNIVPSSHPSLNPLDDDDDIDDTNDENNHTNNDNSHLVSDEIGTLRLEGLPSGRTLEFHLPSLTHAWRSLAGTERQQRKPWDSNSGPSHGGSQSTTHRSRLPGQKILSRALEYLHFEANSYDRVPAALRRFFVVAPPPPLPTDKGEHDEDESHNHQAQTAKLQFRSLPDGRERRAGFTIALARELAKVFEDDGGAGSIEWVSLDADPKAPVWSFGLDVDMQGDEMEGKKGVGRNEEEEMEIWRVSRRDHSNTTNLLTKSKASGSAPGKISLHPFPGYRVNSIFPQSGNPFASGQQTSSPSSSSVLGVPNVSNTLLINANSLPKSPASNKFRGTIARRTYVEDFGIGRFGSGIRGAPCDAEVREVDGFARRGEQEVRGLDVPVDDPVVVEVGEAGEEVAEEGFAG
ncbi:hypothetical protein D0869_14117 [Hortaea werneckii]|uniref:F-box domain-containing protein n=1 Tax=Hortaea werneckii TaxID=91943 RepID=A0A3M6W303_HORWE|nr:hypothetical protein D0869_14117 [Hortaea werneckii]